MNPLAFQAFIERLEIEADAAEALRKLDCNDLAHRIEFHIGLALFLSGRRCHD